MRYKSGTKVTAKVGSVTVSIDRIEEESTGREGVAVYADTHIERVRPKDLLALVKGLATSVFDAAVVCCNRTTDAAGLERIHPQAIAGAFLKAVEDIVEGRKDPDIEKSVVKDVLVEELPDGSEVEVPYVRPGTETVH